MVRFKDFPDVLVMHEFPCLFRMIVKIIGRFQKFKMFCRSLYELLVPGESCSVGSDW